MLNLFCYVKLNININVKLMLFNFKNKFFLILNMKIYILNVYFINK